MTDTPELPEPPPDPVAEERDAFYRGLRETLADCVAALDRMEAAKRGKRPDPSPEVLAEDLRAGHTQWCLDNGLPCEDEVLAGEVFNQPPGYAVAEARDQLDDDSPWCAIHLRAFEIVARDNGEE